MWVLQQGFHHGGTEGTEKKKEAGEKEERKFKETNSESPLTSGPHHLTDECLLSPCPPW